ALFHVGFAVKDITPCGSCPQYLGGFGYGDPVDGSQAHDPLQVRAMAIANDAGKMVLFAIVDTQGWFAGNQEGPWGNRDARLDAAEEISASTPYAISDENIIVSSTHSHAAPTIMGIWGPTDVAYLKVVHDQTVRALVDAATHLHDANLYASNGDISTVTISGITQTDGYQGWRPDGNTPVLWARDPNTGATIGTYVNVPTHADIVNGVGLRTMSADHIGVERDILDQRLGGTSVVAMGTLGRQETIVQTDGLDAARWVGQFVSNEVFRSMATARPITDSTIASAQQYVLVPATNPALAALNAPNRAADALGSVTGDRVGSHCADLQIDTYCTIDRETLPPYAAGGAFGAWFTASRIGDVVYATEPGEAFPEVSTGIRRAMGAPDVRIIGMAQDQLGYYYPPEAYPWTFYNNSDHQIYNASLALGDINVQAQALNAALLGFSPNVTHETNQYDSPATSQHVGVQFFPVTREGTNPIVAFRSYASWAASRNAPSSITQGVLDDTGYRGPIDWSFGDGSSASMLDGFFTHRFPGPGTYDVRATVTDPEDGTHWSWIQTVIVDPPLAAVVTHDGGALVAGVSGGKGTIVAAHWSFSDGSASDGLTVTPPSSTTGSVTVVDAAGNQATTSF
ncbi:MAG: PKD domain-containing protein, partial [Actinomycetota bacterium]